MIETKKKGDIAGGKAASRPPMEEMHERFLAQLNSRLVTRRLPQNIAQRAKRVFTGKSERLEAAAE